MSSYTPSDEDCDEYESYNEEVGTSSKLSNEMEELLSKFYTFLTGPDVNRDPKSCEQVVGDFRRICKAVSAKSFVQLLEKNFLREKYLSQHCRERKFTAETIKKYLRTLIDFAHFLISEEPIPEISKEEAINNCLDKTTK